METAKVYPLNYFPNIEDGQKLSSLPDIRAKLIKSLTTIIKGSPPKKPWTDSFKPLPHGLWTGPSSIAYLFFWLSKTHPDLIIEDKLPKDWCLAYLDCGSDKHPVAGKGIGVKNEYMAFNTVKAIATHDLECVEKLKNAAAISNVDHDPGENEFLQGRSGTLALLRIVRHWIPEASEGLDQVMDLIIQHVLTNRPWIWGFAKKAPYLGAAHGSIGIITQIVLSKPDYATRLEPDLIEHLDLQRDNGNWYFRNDGPDPGECVQFCHGAPGFVFSLIKLRPHFPKLHSRIDHAMQLARKCIWKEGLLLKEPNLCHGITGNALALESPQREHFMSYATAERIQSGAKDGTYIMSDDRYGLQWGEAGRAWGWTVLDANKVEEMGWPAYTDV